MIIPTVFTTTMFTPTILHPLITLTILHSYVSCSHVDSNNNEVSGKLLKVMLDSMIPGHTPSPETGSAQSAGKTTPLPISLQILNSLAMHAKIRLMEMIKMHLIKVVEGKNLDGQVTPALLETYSRLLVWLGTRNFQCACPNTCISMVTLCTHRSTVSVQ